MPRTDLEILKDVRIATPCSVGWDTMEGDERVRHCAQCDKLVYNLAKLTAAEAVALLRAPGGPPCIQLWRRADGTVLTADCPVGLKLVSRRRGRVAMAAALALGLMGGGAWAMQRTLVERIAQSRPLGGEPLPPEALGTLAGRPVRLGGKPQLAPPKPRRRRQPKPQPLTGDVLIDPATCPVRGEAGGARPLPDPAK